MRLLASMAKMMTYFTYCASQSPFIVFAIRPLENTTPVNFDLKLVWDSNRRAVKKTHSHLR